ncbi:MAG: type II toxin-antitoxin system VapC family toxin [Roseiarcus sp.]|uniref:type II toxin-antitoxin system VapC family toxin n=2 Tax=Roseiarcus sp. TaxID=1969460 RepID=UPI003BAF29B3
MCYFDTSFLTPLIREEKTSSRIARFIAGLPTGELAISQWTEVEVASLLARHARMGAIRSDEAREVNALFEHIVRRSFVVLSPGSGDYILARRYLRDYETGLRAGDALHLAIAGNHQAEAIYSLDKTMIKAGNILDLPVSGL